MTQPLLLLTIIILSLSGVTLGEASTSQPGIVGMLSGDAEAGFARAVEPMDFVFPTDHGPHPDYKIEWWYHTGNLRTSDGREFGYHLTFFRNALRPKIPKRESHLATNQIYMAHFALTDIEPKTHVSLERYSRGAAGLAGARGEPTYKVWLEDWSAEAVDTHIIRLRAVDNQIKPQIAIDLLLRETRQPILHGEQGLSQKGPEQGNANHYYSLVGLRTQGTITSDGKTYRVTGISWMDHEFGTSALSKGVVGWDWFGLQLDDDAALMFGRLRHHNGRDGGIFEGTVAYVDGRQIQIQPQDFTLTVTDHWTSSETGITYPSGWQMDFPKLDIELQIQPLIPNQELSTGFTYWEGAVSVEGMMNGVRVKGRGYTELTGYDQ